VTELAQEYQPKNIVIFSDGTGQRGGIYVDEERSNVYKLYRASRADPETGISPDLQVAYYDPGLGTLPTGGGAFKRTYGSIYNFISQATGLGITKNIIECYANIIQLWKPGDRIYLFGFSRGAYTVRCLATVICQCGIPTEDSGKPLRRDLAGARSVAAKAVKSIYQHVSSSRDAKFAPQREALAVRFRERYKSSDPTDGSLPNAHPYFVGVFDTVASLSNTTSLMILALISTLLHISVSAAIDWAFPGENFWYWYGWVAVWATCAVVAALVFTHFKAAWKLPGFFLWDVVHLTNFRQRFYDQYLNKKVTYARHAISIDERRADFPRVPWGGAGSLRRRQPDELAQLEQLWFAGNHADIGGGYPENESRLSDISLQWMVDAATNNLLGASKLLVNADALHLHGRPYGIQHDETRNLAFKYARKNLREPVEQAPLHPTVLTRFNMQVQQYDIVSDYRPEALRNHASVRQHYSGVPLPYVTAGQMVSGWSKALNEFIKEKFQSAAGFIVGSIYPADWQGDKAMKRFTADSLVSFIALAALVAGLAVAAWILLFWQIFPWLRQGTWNSYPISHWLEIHQSWVGLQHILDWLMKLPLTLGVAGTAVVLFWLLGRFSAWLYRMATIGKGKQVTPSQVHH
jgi:uncharacterized protein (DUF2235 family)